MFRLQVAFSIEFYLAKLDILLGEIHFEKLLAAS